MHLPPLGIRGRLFLLGILPAAAIVAAVIAAHVLRTRAIVTRSAEAMLVDHAALVAAEVDRGTREALTAAQGMALAARNGLFGRRVESLRLAREVLESHPRLSAAYFGYEPDADGLDARAAGRAAAPGGADGPAGLPAESLGPDGRFLPCWRRDRRQPGTIRLEPLTMLDGLFYEGCRQRFLDPAQAERGMVTEPHETEGRLMVEQTWPIEIGGRFAGVAGVDRGLDGLRGDLAAVRDRLRAAGWNVDIFLVSRLGRVIAATVEADELAARNVADTAYADVLGGFHSSLTAEGVRQARDPLTGAPCLYAGAKVPTGSWTVVAQLPRRDVFARLERPLWEAAGLGLAGLAGLLGLMVWVADGITRRIGVAMDVSRRVADGDLTATVSAADRAAAVGRGDEAGRLVRDVAAMTDGLRSIVSGVKQSSLDLDATARQLSAAGSQQEAAIGSLGASTSEAAVASRQIAVTGRELLGTMNEVADVAADTARVADAGRENLGEVGRTMAQLEQSSADFSQRLAAIRRRAEDINMVITTITKVADQTNLLSINAAIEAEKAGEYGQGFSVVAREIRRLADQTAVATLDIERLVEQMQQAVTVGVAEMERFSADVQTGVDRVAGISQQFADVIDKVHGLTGRFDFVKQGMQTQAEGAQQITEALLTLNDGSRAAADALREFKEASQHMVGAVAGLTDTVSRFRVDG